MGTLRMRRKAGVDFEDHWGRKVLLDQWRAVERFQGRWMIGGSEPCRVCEKCEE